jgi:uncharacterized protein (DUF433 family)
MGSNSAELPWIVADPKILGAKPCIRGTRLTVEFILELLANGAGELEIVAAYPQLSSAAVRSAISYAASAMRNEIVWDVKISA